MCFNLIENYKQNLTLQFFSFKDKEKKLVLQNGSIEFINRVFRIELSSMKFEVSLHKEKEGNVAKKSNNRATLFL